MTRQAVMRVALVAFLLLVAPITYVILRIQTRNVQARATDKARADHIAWNSMLRERAVAVGGFTIGQRFPTLPVTHPLNTRILTTGRASTVLLIRHIPTEPDPNIFFSGVKRFLDGHPSVELIVVSGDRPSIHAALTGRVKHTRIRYAAVETAYLDSLGIPPNALVCAVDGAGVVRARASFANAPTVEDLDSLFAWSGGPAAPRSSLPERWRVRELPVEPGTSHPVICQMHVCKPGRDHYSGLVGSRKATTHG